MLARPDEDVRAYVGSSEFEGFELKSQRKMRVKALEGKLNAAGKRFAIVVSRFNAFITDRLLQSAFDGLVQCGAKAQEHQNHPRARRF